MSLLLEAVDALTLPVKVKTITQKRNGREFVFDSNDHPVMMVVKSELPPLLDQLEAAVSSSTGGPAGKGSLASERNVLDADALFQAMVIRDRIRDWCHLEHVDHDRDSNTVSLRRWYAATLKHDIDEDHHVRILRSWRGFIEAKLDPQREMDLPWACPICGADTWWNAGHEYRRPLVIRYRADGPDMVQHARAMCRSCERVWHVRELAYALEHPETNDEGEAS